MVGNARVGAATIKISDSVSTFFERAGEEKECCFYSVVVSFVDTHCFSLSWNRFSLSTQNGQTKAKKNAIAQENLLSAAPALSLSSSLLSLCLTENIKSHEIN